MRIAPSRLTVEWGDLARMGRHVDVLVSSDDGHLSHGGGVSRSLWRGAGSTLRDDPTITQLRQARRSGRPGPRCGDVLVSTAGDLDASYLVHAVTIDFERGTRLQDNELSGLYGRCLDTALDLGLRSIGFPLLASGAAGGTEAESANALWQAMRRRRFDPRGLRVFLVTLGTPPPVPEADDTPMPTSLFKEVASRAHHWGHGVEDAFRRVHEDWAPRRGEAPGTDAAIRLLDIVTALDTWNGDEQPAVLRAAIEDRDRLVRSTRGALPRGAAVSRQFVAPVVAALLAQHPDAGFAMVGSASLLQFMPSRPPGWDSLTGPGGVDLENLPGLPTFDDLLGTSAERAVGSEVAPAAFTAGGSAEGDVRSPRVSFDAGTGPVRALRDLIWDRLPPDARAALDRSLEEEGYRGEPRERLLEHCARYDPSRLLRDVFRGTELPPIALGLGFPRPSKDPDLLVDQILEGLGFPPEPGGDSLAALSASSRALRRSAPDLDSSGLEAAITTIAKRVERLLRLQLRFLVGAGFGMGAEDWARRRGLVKDFRDFERASMGTIAGFLREAGKELQDTDTPRARDLRRVVTDPAVPAALNHLITIRNKAVHATVDGDPRADSATRERAHRFCDVVDDLVEAWRKDSGAFPAQALVEAVRYDRWGRRTVSVLVEGERLTVFTDHEMVPGRTYLLKHFTNPWSIDPIIVERGGSLVGDDADRS